MAHPSRRDVLRLGLAISVVGLPALAGCTLSDPRIEDPAGTRTLVPTPTDGSASPSSTATPTSTPTRSAAQRSAQVESQLAGLAAGIRRGPRRSGLSARQRTLLSAVAAAHVAHAKALGGHAPGRSSAAPRGSLPESLRQLARSERAAARRYRRAALDSSGADALLWSSLSVAATGFSAAVTDSSPPAVARLRSPAAAAVLSDTAATQELVRQLHAVIYGYQLAIGTLPTLNPSRNRAVRELLEHRVVRDRLIAWLVRRSADVPAPEAAYVPSVNLTDAGSAAKLIMRMLVALQPFCGLSIAAADDRDRERALDLLSATISRAQTWGAPLDTWPGYA